MAIVFPAELYQYDAAEQSGAAAEIRGLRRALLAAQEKDAEFGEPCREEPRDNGDSGNRERTAKRGRSENCQTFGKKRQTRNQGGIEVSGKSRDIRDLSGAQSRNRTSDTRIFKTCAENKLLSLLRYFADFRGVQKTVQWRY